jgi:hypothetical protein
VLQYPERENSALFFAHVEVQSNLGLPGWCFDRL